MVTTAKPNAVILYRGNKSLDLITPVIAEVLQEEYYIKTTTQRFEEETAYDKINDWCKEHWPDLESAVIVSDRTCTAATNRGLYRKELDCVYNSLVEKLDNIAADAAIRFVLMRAGCFEEEVISGRVSFPIEGYGLGLEKTKEAYIALLSQVREKPSHIFVVRDCLDEHLPFKRYSDNNICQQTVKSWLEEGLGPNTPIIECFNVPSDPASEIVDFP